MLFGIGAMDKITEEVERQRASPRAVYNLCRAFSFGFNICRNHKEMTPKLLIELGRLIEPNTVKGYRVTPVTFANGGLSCHHSLISRQIDLLCAELNALSNESTEIQYSQLVEWIRALLWVHPFNDGNGRLAFLLFNLYKPFSSIDFTSTPRTIMFLTKLPEFDWS